MTAAARTPARLVHEVVRHALIAADPEHAVARHAPQIAADLARFKSLTLIAVGKAAAGMTRGFIPIVNDRIRVGYVVLPRDAPGRASDLGNAQPNLLVDRSDHPTPTHASVDAARRAMRFCAQAAGLDGEAVVLLISGGASAMMSLPAPPLTLEEVAAIAKDLMNAGASIDELNTVRRRIDDVKGGGLAACSGRAPIFTYAISDVRGDDLRVVGSGPGILDDATNADALRVLAKYGLVDRVPAIRDALTIPRPPDHDRREPFPPAPRQTARLLFNNRACLDMLAPALADPGDVVEIRPGVHGEAGDVARAFAAHLDRESRSGPAARPRIVLWGGETTVTVRGGGVGGRNQEFALAAALALDDLRAIPPAQLSNPPRFLIASFGTDGVDGPTGAAGAFVTEHTAKLAVRTGLDPGAALHANDSYTFFTSYEARVEPALIRTGPTGANVNDIMLGVIWPA